MAIDDRGDEPAVRQPGDGGVKRFGSEIGDCVVGVKAGLDLMADFVQPSTAVAM